jgi:hypothetical protein
VRQSTGRSDYEDHSVLSGESAENNQARELREVRARHRDDGGRASPLIGGVGGHSCHQRDDESQEALEIPENPQRPYASHLRREMKRWSDPCGDVGRPAEMPGPPVEPRALDIGPSNRISEIPCRVSSDLHEWRNDWGTVSTRDSAKLQCE